MSDTSDLKYELKLRKSALERWRRYLSGGRTGFRRRDFVKKYLSKLEQEVDMLDREIEYRKKGIFRITDLLKGTRRFVGDITKGVTEYLSPKKSKRHYLVLFALFLIFLIFRNKGSVIGYTVIETVTSNYLSYFLVFILVACLVAFYKLDKK